MAYGTRSKNLTIIVTHGADKAKQKHTVFSKTVPGGYYLKLTKDNKLQVGNLTHRYTLSREL